MQDIRKPYSHSKSSIHHGAVDLRRKVEDFESNNYPHDNIISDEEEPHVIPIQKTANSTRGYRDISKKELYPRRRDGVEFRNPYNGPANNKNTIIFIVATVIVIATVILLTYVFDSAKVTIIPKYKDVENLNRSYVISAKGTEGTIPYILATTTVTKSKKLPVSESKLVESKASGKVIIFNNFDENEQKLLKNTRFQSNAGKIYRINQSVTVPGKRGTTPGSIEVTVYADGTGAEYNSGPSDFTIPGFKGSTRYALFYGRSNGPLSGGASGNVSLVSKPDLDGAKDELAIEINKTIQESFKEVKRDGYTPLVDAVKIIYEDNEKDLVTGQSSTYTLTAHGYMPLADEKVLAVAVASTITNYNNEPVRLEYVNTLSFTPKDTSTIGTDKDTDILIEGNPRVVWLTDFEAVKELLLDKSKSEFTAIMSGIPSIDRASNSFFPMWLSTFPSKVSSIKVEENLKAR